MELHTDEESVMSQVTLPEHFSGWGRVVHGGILSTLLDEIMGWAGLYLLRQITLTKSMTIEFIKAVYVGETLEVVGRVMGTKGKRNADIEGVITRNNGEVCARARGDFTTLSPKLAIRLGIMNEAQQQQFFEPLFKKIPGTHD
ncbi:MAG: PaaI family thioesterase [Desulfobacterales bacterium]|nr:PaaI family thioesterase [Desulfobacterales bacterium]MDX2513453.1 PaaI family thioesterase [Desulfobacterales bacterium]